MKKIIELYKRLFWTCEKYAKKAGVNVGSDCYISTKYFGSEPYLITIGNHVQLTTGVRIFTHGASWVLRSKYPDFDLFGKVRIGNNVYVGNCAMIMPGVCIGDDVVIGAGTVVTKSIASGSVVAGNPGKVIGNIKEYEEKHIKYNLGLKGVDSNEKMRILLSLSDEDFISK